MKSPRLLAATTATGLMTLGIAVPASADDTGTSTATVTVTGGALEISVKTAPRSLGSRGNSAKAATVSGSLGEVVVSDNRAAPEGSGWVASVVSTPFRSRTGPAIPASRVGYTAGKIDKVGTATYQANDPENLSRASAVVTATDITGNNTSTWTPTIHVNVPGGLAAGVYTATITHSVV